MTVDAQMPRGNPAIPAPPDVAAKLQTTDLADAIEGVTPVEPPAPALAPTPAPIQPQVLAPIQPQPPAPIQPQAPAPVQAQAPVPPQAPTDDAFDITSLLKDVGVIQAPAPLAAPTPTPAPTPGTPATPAPVVDRDQLRQQAINQLMQTDYRLNDEDSRKLISEPETVIPRIAAQMHIHLAERMAEHIAQAVPTLVESQLQTALAAQKAELEFYSKYPALNKNEFRDTVVQSLMLARQALPTADRDTVMRRGAQLAAFEIRSRFGAAPTQRPQQPFVPAAPGGGIVPASPSSGNPFEAFAAEDVRGADPFPW